MKRLYLLSSILAFSLILLFYYDYNKTQQILNKRHYEEATFVISNAKRYDMVILAHKNLVHQYFMIEGRTSDSKLCIRYGLDKTFIQTDKLGIKKWMSDGRQIISGFDWIDDLVKKQTLWADTVSIISQDKISWMHQTYTVYYYRASSQSNSNGIVLIPFESIILYILCLIIFLNTSLKIILNKKSALLQGIVKHLVLLFTSLILSWFFAGFSIHGAIFYILFAKNLISFYILDAMLRRYNHNYGGYSFGKKESLKFLYIVLFGLIIEFTGGHICNFIYFNVLLGGDNFTYSFSDFTNILGWFKYWLYFGIANFANNLISYISSLRKSEKEVTHKMQSHALTESNISALQSRINPHFLYNALNSIASLAKTEPKKTEEMALELATFYDKCTDNTKEPKVSIREELKVLDSYLKIEKIRFGDTLHFEKEIEEECLDIQIPSFLLQPLVENAIKYGYNDSKNHIYIKVIVSCTIDSTIIRVYDDGQPFSSDIESGYGLNSIRQKLKWLFPDRSTLSFVNVPVKYVEIEIKNTAL
ncbi:MAG: histidine kinase [Saprospiraceae bacterium]